MTNLDKDKVITEFTNAYTQVNGKAPSLEIKSGWYSVDGGKNVRLSQLKEMTASLLASSNDKAKPVSTSKTPKKSNTSTSPKSKSGFSVKQFWADKLQQQDPGSTLPR
ncbi:MAG: hypothetical protein AXW14_03875 [Alteromonas sp. Nap_26]|nr:MAG: hypothetical protein AXW14_03875 [Alteromonas sp. Nap_26]